MDSPKYLVVITLVEGQNFTLPDCVIDKTAQATVFAEARFDNEPLRSDPVKLTNTNPEFVTELAWQLDRRSLHQFRVERRAIKLQVFLQTSPIKKSSKDGTTLSPTGSNSTCLEANQTHLVGYTIIDIRAAQEHKQQKFEWRPLLNPKFRKPSYSRPEIQLAVSLIKCEENEQEAIPNGYREAPYTLRFQKADVDSSLVASSCDKIGEYSDESFDDDEAYDRSTNSLYKTCIDFTLASDEYDKGKTSVNPHIAIIENDIKIKVLDGNHYIYDAQENNSTIEDCKIFFSIEASIAFISDLEAISLGHTRDFLDSTSKSTTYYFTFSLFGSSLKSDEFTIAECNLNSKIVKFNVTTTSVKLLNTYFTLNSTLDIKLYNSHKKVLGFTTVQMDQLCCDNEDDLQNGRSIEGMFSLQSCADNTTDHPESPTVGIAVTLTQLKSFNPVSHSKDRPMLKSPTAKNFEVLSNLCGDSKTTVQEDNPPETSQRQSQSVVGENGPDKQPFGPDDIQSSEVQSGYSNENQMRHFCFTIDLKTLTTLEDVNIDLSSLLIRYSYSFFGYTDTITTDSSIPIGPNEALIPHGFCEFNFATTSSSLKYAFSNVPLILELVMNRRPTLLDAGSSVHEEVDCESVGFATLKFADLFDIDRLKISEENCTMTTTTILGCDKSELGKVQLYLSLKDLGPTRINRDVIHENHSGRAKGSSLNERVNFVTDIDKLLVDASNEIESWKDQQLLSFKIELEQKEQEYLSNITHKLEAKETKRDAELKKKMGDLNKLERKLRHALLSVESKEKHLDQKEQQLIDKDKELSARLATIDSELARAIEEVKSCYKQKDVDFSSNRNIYDESQKVKINKLANGISQPIRVTRRSSLRDQTAVSSRSPGIPLPVRSTSLVRGSIDVQSSKLPLR